jgi:hypothetical protein
MAPNIRLLLSAVVSFAFYFCWSYWANSLATEDHVLVLRSALVQGSLSATITLLFTLGIEMSVKRFGGHCFSLVFVVPLLCGVHARTPHNLAFLNSFRHALDTSAQYFKSACMAGALLAPLLPITVQGGLAIAVNLLNGTPNLWLTVTPSIVISAIYGYLYTFTLMKERAKAKVNHS